MDESFEYEIDSEEVRRLQLTPTGEFDTIQRIELPDSPVIVTEHRFALYQSPDGTIYYPFVPEVHNQPIFGPRLLATIGWLKSQAHCSYSTIDQYFDDVLGVGGTQSNPLTQLPSQYRKSFRRSSSQLT